MRTGIFLAAAVLVTLLAPREAFADFATSVSATNYLSSCSGQSFCSFSGEGVNHGQFFDYSGQVSASAEYWHLSGGVSYRQGDFGQTGFLLTTNAGFSDALTILGGSGLGYVRYVFGGAVHWATEQGVGGAIQFSQDGLQEGASYGGHQNGSISYTYATDLYHFTFGDPVTIGFTASARSQGTMSDSCNQCSGFDWDLSQISVFDENLNPVDATIIFASQVPEPSSVILLLTCMACVVPVRRRPGRLKKGVLTSGVLVPAWAKRNP